jgi:hypothetical protein
MCFHLIQPIFAPQTSATGTALRLIVLVRKKGAFVHHIELIFLFFHKSSLVVAHFGN